MRRATNLRSRILSGVVCLVAILPASAPAALAPELPVEAFAQLPFMGQVAVSPSGRYVAATVLDASHKYGFAIFDLDQLGKKPPFHASAGDWDVNWVHWKTDDRLLVSGRMAFQRNQVAVLETRLFAVNADGSHRKRLVQPKRHSKSSLAETVGSQMVQVADRVVDYLPGDPRNILMTYNPADPSRPRLYRVDVVTDRQVEIEPGRDNIQWWILDRKGRVRLAQGRDRNKLNTGWKTYYRASEKGPWKEIWDEAKQQASLDPVVFDKSDPDIVYVTSDHENGRTGLYRFKLSTGEFVDKLFLHPEVDLDHVILSPEGTDIDGLTYITDVTHTEWLSEKMAAIDNDIKAQLPGWVTTIVSRSYDNSRMIVKASAPDHAARYYLYEPAARKLQYFSFTYAALDKYDLARMFRLKYKARDGLEIPAYLTLPPGTPNPPATPLPAVVMPHGGPEARDYAQFDPMVQMLANHGYAVLQMNFRGSAGYGSEFKEAGRREWGEAMQDDVTDGTIWLAKSGIADAARICIVGGSYGGYAALMGVVKEPTLYKCAVSINGVTDLPDFIAYLDNFVGGRSAASRRIGNLWSDGEKLARNSPARRAADIKVPVLLMQGTDDRVVPVEQTKKMANALKGAGKSYRFIELKDEEHWLTHGDTRLQAFEELDNFLAEQLH